MPQEIRVLVVDDDAMNAVAIRRLLELEGIEATTVPTAEDALCQLGQRPYHTIVTDLRLPGASGQELARRLRQTYLIALSGDLPGLARSMYFDRTLRKPCDPEVLLRAIIEGSTPPDGIGPGRKRS